MGKKSRRKVKKSERAQFSQHEANARSAGLPPFSSSITSYASESSFANPFENSPSPKTGWARELRLAEKELKDSRYRSADVVLRTAKAAFAMRQFTRLGEIIGKAESKGVAMDGAANVANVQGWKDECAAYKKLPTRLNDSGVQSMLKKAVEEDMSLDSTTFDHDTYSNLSALQYAALQGDTPLLERLVSLGAALDYPHEEISEARNNPGKTTKPQGCTALIMALVGALCARQCLQFEGEAKWRRTYEGEIECAIALVRMGANVDVRLRLPTGRDADSEDYEMMKIMNWIGKTARELASESGSELLVQTMERFNRSAEDRIKLVHCRCGSRLPWGKCHSGTSGAGRHYDPAKENSGQEEGKLNWRFSPCAPCPCKNGNKTYFKCCWDENFREYFQDDETAVLSISTSTQINDDNRKFIMGSHPRFVPAAPGIDMMQNMNPDELRKLHCDAIRDGGQAFLEETSRAFHPKSQLGKWDPNVYAGVVEHIDDYFQWNDIHWNIPKLELRKRVAEWNKALESYCDDEGLAGPDREEITKLHTASELAPCANVNCGQMESTIKEFAQCSKCMSVAYCSRACSKEDWAFHKGRCTAHDW